MSRLALLPLPRSDASLANHPEDRVRRHIEQRPNLAGIQSGHVEATDLLRLIGIQSRVATRNVHPLEMLQDRASIDLELIGQILDRHASLVGLCKITNFALIQ